MTPIHRFIDRLPLRLSSRLPRWIQPGHILYDELLSDALLATARAARTWRAGSGANFSTWAGLLVDRELRHWPRKLKAQRRQSPGRSIDYAVHNAAARAPYAESSVPWNVLDAREQGLVALRLAGISGDHTADLMGCTRWEMQLAKWSAESKIQEALA